MLNSFALGLLFIASIVFSAWRLMRLLQFLQQEEYDPRRFIKWVQENKAFDRRGSTTCISAAFFLALIPLGPYWVFFICALCALLLVVHVYREPDPRKSGKIKLNLTERAKRILYLAVFLCTFFLLAEFLFFCSLPSPWGAVLLTIDLIILFQILPLFLVVSVKILSPGESRRQKAFLNEAKEKIREYNPFVIGITGSYGKTSCKSILSQVLDTSLGSTFWPAKGINTPMGITREIRERLSPNHKYAVIEMGAYRPGSIRNLCELTPPKAGLITAVGLMHLDRMGGAEEVLRAKSELAQAIPDMGILVCNADNEGSLKIAETYPKEQTLLYGLNPRKGLDAKITEYKFEEEGTSFEIVWKRKKYSGFSKMHGRSALSNILGCFTMACALGADPEYALAAVRNLEPVDNRLQVRKNGSYTQINDAYNSNPDGFLAALEVLEELPAEKRLLMTPGMIELGEKQAEKNSLVAAKAAEICDNVIIVGDVNRQALEDGLLGAGFSEDAIHCVRGREEAFTELSQLVSAGDVVLIENDLPDLFEVQVDF